MPVKWTGHLATVESDFTSADETLAEYRRRVRPRRRSSRWSQLRRALWWSRGGRG